MFLYINNRGGVPLAYISCTKEKIAANVQRKVNGATSGGDSSKAQVQDTNLEVVLEAKNKLFLPLVEFDQIT
jgi:hypothetical protein